MNEESRFLEWKSNKLDNLKYQRAIVMLASGYSGLEVAKHLGVTQRCVQKWFKEGSFNDSLKYAIHMTFQSAIAKAVDFADRAVAILIQIAEDADTPSKHRIEAIKVLFDICLRATQKTPENIREFELKENLTVLTQFANVQTVVKQHHIALDKPELGKGLEEMRTMWKLLYPDQPYPDDDQELRDWWYRYDKRY